MPAKLTQIDLYDGRLFLCKPKMLLVLGPRTTDAPDNPSTFLGLFLPRDAMHPRY